MDPFTLFNLGTMLIGGMSKAKQQESTNAKARAMRDQTRRNSYKDINYFLDLANMQNMEMEQATNERIYQRQLQALKDRSKIMISAGEAGVGGSSIARLVQTNQMSAGYDQALYDANLESQLTASAIQGKQKIAEGKSRINNANNQASSQIVEHPWLKQTLSMAPSMYLMYKKSKME